MKTVSNRRPLNMLLRPPTPPPPMPARCPRTYLCVLTAGTRLDRTHRYRAADGTYIAARPSGDSSPSKARRCRGVMNCPGWQIFWR